MKQPIAIVHKRKKHPDIQYDVLIYCARGSALGNEFNFRTTSQFETQTAGSRDESCDQMRLQMLKYLLDDKNMFPKSQKVKDAFNHIFREYRAGKAVALECYCLNHDPKTGVREGLRCHTEDIRTIVENVAHALDNHITKHEALMSLRRLWESLDNKNV